MTEDENFRSPHLKVAHKLWKEHLAPQDFAIDATCGNGHDTLFLSSLITEGQLYAFDIQPQAIQNAKMLLQNHLDADQLARISLFQKSHEKWDTMNFSKAPRLIVYNLGYLPGGDKRITTRKPTTLTSLCGGLSLIDPGGAISITCYSGHEEGKKEEDAILEFLTSLCPKSWLVCHHKFANRPKSASLFWVLRLKKMY